MRLLGNKAIVYLPPNKTGSGIILPPSAKDDKKDAWKRGTVVALGAAVKPDLPVKVRDAVLFQYGFDTMDKTALAALAKEDDFFDVDGDLWLGNAESLFAVIEMKKYGKEHKGDKK